MIRKLMLAATLFAALAEARVFELRTYHCLPGRLEALKARFRNHTVKLFEKHGIQNIGYWVPQDADKGKDTTLIYIVAHPDKEAAAKAWAAFRVDPDWVKARTESEKDGKIVDKVESVYMDAVDFSKLK
jgi:hypothetical protein